MHRRSLITEPLKGRRKRSRIWDDNTIKGGVGVAVKLMPESKREEKLPGIKLTFVGCLISDRFDLRAIDAKIGKVA